MNDRRAKRLIPRPEAMEERIPLSATAPAIHTLLAAHVRHPPRGPIVVNLDPQATGIRITDAAIDRRVGVIRIEGVVTFPPLNPAPYFPPYYPPYGPPTASVGLYVTQAAGPRRNVEGYVTSHPMDDPSSGFTAPFALYVTADSGRFRRGWARVELSTFASYDYSTTSVSPSARAIVQLTPTRF